MNNLLRRSLIVMVISLVAVSCNSQKSSDKREIEEKGNTVMIIAPQAYKNESKDKLIIDVRTPEEYAEGHIEGAINIDFMNENFVSNISKLEDKGTVFIYCRSGNRSGKSTPEFLEAGFKQVVDLEGGIKAWEANNFEIIK